MSALSLRNRDETRKFYAYLYAFPTLENGYEPQIGLCWNESREGYDLGVGSVGSLDGHGYRVFKFRKGAEKLELTVVMLRTPELSAREVPDDHERKFWRVFPYADLRTYVLRGQRFSRETNFMLRHVMDKFMERA